MNILIAIDSFKGSLSSAQAAGAIQKGILSAAPDCRVTVLPAADGGEGTVDTLVSGLGGQRIRARVTGPTGQPLWAEYGWLPQQQTAVFEMAQAAGLPLVPEELRDPMNTTTYGVGELLLDALERGFRRFLIGIGGSATNDCGLGMLQALGVRFNDAQGAPVGPFGRDVGSVSSVDISALDPRLARCSITVACDVTNPLYGPTGASAVFAPQKGASPETVAEMDAAHRRFSALVEETLGMGGAHSPGAGAAGGLGYALQVFLGARLRSGTDTVLELLDFDRLAADSHLVITGEGRLDGQTAMGKLSSGVARRAKAQGAAVVALCGCVGPGADTCTDWGIDACFPIPSGPCSEEQAMDPHTAAENLQRTAR